MNNTIPQSLTLAQCFERALIAEHFLRDLYLALAQKFAAFPQLVDFWEDMAGDEVIHAQRLVAQRDALSAEQLQRPADMPATLEEMLRTCHFSVEEAVADIHDFHAAYNLTVELENSEINDVFIFLTTQFLADNDAVKALIVSKLQDHVNKVMSLSERFGGIEGRRLIKSQ